MGKSSGKEKSPSIASDNLESKQQLSIIDIIGEGQIEGPISGLKSIFLNKTPVQADDGSYNFNGVEVEWTSGTQSQLPLSGFSETQNEIPVSLEVKYKTPIVRTITDPYIDRVRVTVGVSSLYGQTTSGDTYRTDVKLAVQISVGNGWVTKKTVELIDKKTRTQYLTSVILDDLPSTPFNIRVARITPDSNSDLLVNNTVWSSYTEIYDAKLSYPNTALVGLRFDSSQFNGVPSRTYLIRGIRCKIPNNYDPILRTYNGIWLGEFKTEWTNNPAWIVYDILKNNRYGMARRFGQFSVDKFMLYSIAQYCDQLVDDGFGGLEPRFTCNCYITEQSQAYDLINNFFSIFRALPIWDGMQLSAVIDRPGDTVAIYTNANVVDGKFTYSSSAMKDRHTAVRVKYIDPNNGWEPVTEYVADDEAIKRFGLNILDVEAFGCTSRGQAHRTGKWIITTEKYERQTVNFSVGRAGLKHLPGDVIGILDNEYVMSQSGGRIAAAVNNIVTLDRDVKIDKNSYLTYQDVNTKLVKVKVLSQKSSNTLVLEQNVNSDQWSTWILTNINVSLRLFKALAISENDDGTHSITALEHEPKKEAIVDNGAVFAPAKNQSISWGIPPIEGLAVSITPDSDEYQAVLSWTTPRTMNHLEFQVAILRNGNLVSRQNVVEMSVTMSNLDEGKYTASVRGISTEDGRLGDESTVFFTIAAPETPTQLVFASTSNTVTIKPIMPSNVGLGTVFEYYKGTTLDEVRTMKNYLGRTSNKLIDADVQASTTYYYGVIAVNAAGRSGMCTGSAKTADDTVGTAGGIFRIKTADGVFPANNDRATQLFHDVLGMWPSRDTVLIVYSADENNNVTKTETKMYDGAKWIEPALFLDGNLLATGSINGDRLVAYSEIKSPIIRGGSININDRFVVDSNGHLTVTAADELGKFTLKKNCMEFFDEKGFRVARLGVWK
ncbi:host specificity protein J [uncultured Gilliamella sp.]|uniref:host specificity protein J n=1 Tax=uncultured Gilliamella sp. TaxID=1193505 RepID=UPI0025D99812|nr:phage tail protein [uncultured Gilliamella sp.]